MVESVHGKPLPEITDLTRPFWTAAKNGKLMMQKCGKCETVNFPPKPWCVECGDRDLEWTEVKPTGSIYSHTVSLSVAMNYPAWQSELPVILCIIDMDDGARMYAQLTDCLPETIEIGMRVEAYFEDISEDAGIPKFRPIAGADDSTQSNNA